MRTVLIIVEKTDDVYWAYATDLTGVSGVGNTIQEAKASAVNCIKIQVEEGNIPDQAYQPFFQY